MGVPPACSSQECTQCKHESPDYRTRRASFERKEDGHAAQAGLNAARVILARGLELLAAGSQPLPGGHRASHARGRATEVRPPLKREPAETVAMRQRLREDVKAGEGYPFKGR